LDLAVRGHLCRVPTKRVRRRSPRRLLSGPLPHGAQRGRRRSRARPTPMLRSCIPARRFSAVVPVR